MDELPTQTLEGALLDGALERSGLSRRAAAKSAGISDTHWKHIAQGWQKLQGGSVVAVRGKPETVARMAAVVGITPEELRGAGRGDAANALEEREQRRVVVVSEYTDEVKLGVKKPAAPDRLFLEHLHKVATAARLTLDAGSVDATRWNLDVVIDMLDKVLGIKRVEWKPEYSGLKSTRDRLRQEAARPDESLEAPRGDFDLAARRGARQRDTDPNQLSQNAAGEENQDVD